MCINVGSMSTLLTTALEAKVGFWSAYLLPLLIFGIGFFLLVSQRRTYIDRPPHGSVVLHAFRIIWIGVRSGFNLDAAKSNSQRAEYGILVPWSDDFVEEIKIGLASCRVFLFFPIYWLYVNLSKYLPVSDFSETLFRITIVLRLKEYSRAFSQMLNNFVSQAGTMGNTSKPGQCEKV
jgi:POT family proton-dependent oligopeptide transporter